MSHLDDLLGLATLAAVGLVAAVALQPLAAGDNPNGALPAAAPAVTAAAAVPTNASDTVPVAGTRASL